MNSAGTEHGMAIAQIGFVDSRHSRAHLSLLGVSALHPRHDCGPELASSGPGLAVQDVLLEQAGERLNRSAITRGTHSPHRARHAMNGESAMQFPALRL